MSFPIFERSQNPSQDRHMQYRPQIAEEKALNGHNTCVKGCSDMKEKAPAFHLSAHLTGEAKYMPRPQYLYSGPTSYPKQNAGAKTRI